MKTLVTKRVVLAGATGTLLLASHAQADVKLSPLFSDNMVMQQKKVVPVFGIADAGESVSVSIAGQTQKSTADAAGKWMVKLSPLAAAPSLDMTVNGKNQIVLHNVAIGEVWIASGQSNMQWPLAWARNAKEEITAANDTLLRSFNVPNVTADTPRGHLDLKGIWQMATPQTAGNFSAVGYFFARELRQKLNVPVGIIHTSWGGTPAEAWTSRSALEASPILKPIVEKWDKSAAEQPEAVRKYNEEILPRWQAEADAAKAVGTAEPKKPDVPDSVLSPYRASNLFNAMIAPLIPYGIQGAIWYQGESNGRNAKQYETLFPEMIRDWRSRWGQGEFPFLFVQLANHDKVQTAPSEGGWAFIREAQLKTLSLPNTGMAVAIDLADADNPGDIHPKNKQDVGRRLALSALAQVYGQKIEYSGPQYDSIAVEGNQIRIKFRHTESGLIAKPGPADASTAAATPTTLKGFAIAGVDENWVWANARIEGNTVVVSNPVVAAPVAVRYGWAMNPIGNLYNGAFLPASPFRSDTFTK